MHFYKGNVHIHSDRSDGSRDLSQIVKVAKDKGLDFIILNDHDVHMFNSSGHYDNCIVIVGAELAWDNQHMLVISEDEELKGRIHTPQDTIDIVKKNKGLSIIAHPFEVGSPVLFSGRNYGWRSWDIDGFDGIEVWNYCSQWKDSVRNIIISGIKFLFFPHGPIKQPCTKSVEKFDEISAKRKVIAIGGSDAHGAKICCGLIEVLSYKFLFGGINNYIFCKQELKGDKEDIKAIIDAIKNGKSYIVNEHLGNGAGFIFKVIKGEREYFSGDDVILQDNMSIEVDSPKGGEIKVIRNGKTYFKTKGKKIKKYILHKGVYRVEIWKKGRLWIFSNNVYVS